MNKKYVSIHLHTDNQVAYIYNESEEGVKPSNSITPYFYKELTFFQVLEGIIKAFALDSEFFVSYIYVIKASKNMIIKIDTENDTNDTVSQKLYKIIKENKR
jgi:hypothetical protein